MFKFIKALVNKTLDSYYLEKSEICLERMNENHKDEKSWDKWCKRFETYYGKYLNKAA